MTEDILSALRRGICGRDQCRVMEARSGCGCAEAADEIEQLRADLAQALADGERMVVMLAEAADQIQQWQALAEKRSVSKKLILP